MRLAGVHNVASSVRFYYVPESSHPTTKRNPTTLAPQRLRTMARRLESSGTGARSIRCRVRCCWSVREACTQPHNISSPSGVIRLVQARHEERRSAADVMTHQREKDITTLQHSATEDAQLLQVECLDPRRHHGEHLHRAGSSSCDRAVTPCRPPSGQRPSGRNPAGGCAMTAPSNLLSAAKRGEASVVQHSAATSTPASSAASRSPRVRAS